MTDCRKRQRERKGTDVVHRCVHRDAETYREVVEPAVCDACPLKVLLGATKGRKTAEALSLPIVDPSQYPSCELRANGHCMVTKIAVTPETCQQCSKESAEHEATLVEKFHNYKTAIRKWIAAGRPTRSDERVAEIHDTFCVNCDKYDPVKRACKHCGCRVNKGAMPLTNKLKMGTEVCPYGLFGEERDA